MNENTNPAKRREWVKNAAIIFLSIMLVLTFFSNTIMNYSLPEVATEYVQSGTITEKVRGTGTITASDPYNVSISESRVISSVAVKADPRLSAGRDHRKHGSGYGEQYRRRPDAFPDTETAKAAKCYIDGRCGTGRIRCRNVAGGFGQ